MDLVAILISLFAVLVLRGLYQVYFHPLSRYPQPRLAGLTNLGRVLSFFNGDSHVKLAEFHAKYGPVVRTGPNCLSFATLEAYNYIHRDNDRLFSKGSFYNFARNPNTTVETVFSAPTHAIHSLVKRRVVGSALRSSKVLEYQYVIEKNVELLLSWLKEEATASRDHRVDIADKIHKFTIATIFEIVQGTALPGKSSELSSDIKIDQAVLADFSMAARLSFGFGMLPWLNYLLTSRVGTALTQMPKYDSAGKLLGIGKVIQICRKVVYEKADVVDGVRVGWDKPSVVRNFLSVPITDPQHMPIDNVFQESTNLIFAGQGSTAAALTAVLFKLGTEEGQKWQRQIRSGMEQKADDRESGLEAVLRETFRLEAPFAIGFPRNVDSSEHCRIPGLQAAIPAGTEVSVNLYVLGRSPETFGDDAAVWKPARWVHTSPHEEPMKNIQEGNPTMFDEDGHSRSEATQSGESYPSTVHDHFFSFGKGPRSCVGRDIAMEMLRSTIHRILENWEIRSVGELRGKSCFEMRYPKVEVELLPR